MKLSIIVPIYGVEKYILQFAQSLIFQLNNDVELILVNDGTKDNSIKIIKSYIHENFPYLKNILWLEQENQGQSVARNYGISIAKGEYITFLDPDDFVSNNYINEIFNVLVDGPDLIQFNAKVYHQEKMKYISKINLTAGLNGQIKNNISYIESIYQKKVWFSWLRVFKREYLDDNFFPKGVNFQDMMAIPKVYRKINSIYNINEDLVCYRVHCESSVHKANYKLVISSKKGLNIYKNNNLLDNIIYLGFLRIYIESGVNFYGFFKQLECFFSDLRIIKLKYFYIFIFYILYFNFKKILKVVLRNI